MLTYESLINEAEKRNLPSTKLRGILREYLQILILKELSQTVENRIFYFTGGTYLRLVHNLKRFSEDLDFYSNRVTQEGFEGVIRTIKKGLARRNIKCEEEFNYYRDILSANLVFPDIEKFYGVTARYSRRGIIIKFEVSKTNFRIKTDVEVISGFGEMFICNCTSSGILFADKIDALSRKDKARHIYDVLFMLGNGFPIDEERLKFLEIKQDPLEVLIHRIKRFSDDNLKKTAKSLSTFLFDESESELIINAKKIMGPLVKKYKG